MLHVAPAFHKASVSTSSPPFYYSPPSSLPSLHILFIPIIPSFLSLSNPSFLSSLCVHALLLQSSSISSSSFYPPPLPPRIRFLKQPAQEFWCTCSNQVKDGAEEIASSCCRGELPARWTCCAADPAKKWHAMVWQRSTRRQLVSRCSIFRQVIKFKHWTTLRPSNWN
jgi:hypothetical protein